MRNPRLVTALGLCLCAAMSVAPAQELSEKEAKRRELNARFDKLGLRERTGFVVDCAEEFLRAPEDKPLEGDFLIAREAPTVKLRIFTHLEPEYFSGADQYMACWANWAYVARSHDNRFYMAASDHLAKGSSDRPLHCRPPVMRTIRAATIPPDRLETRSQPVLT